MKDIFIVSIIVVLAGFLIYLEGREPLTHIEKQGIEANSLLP